MIQLRASKEMIQRYRRLLSSEWTAALPDQVLELLNHLILSQLHQSEATAALRALHQGQNTPALEQIIHRMQSASRFDAQRGLPAFPVDYHFHDSSSPVAMRGLMLSVYFTLSAHEKCEGDLAFLNDLQSLAFLACIHELLDTLKRKHPAEYSILLHAMTLMLIQVEHDASHHLYLLSLLYEYLGNTDKRLETLHNSFRMTSPDDHSYLTKAQEYWSALLDENQVAQARSFIMNLHWKALPTQKGEIEEMLMEVISFDPTKRRKAVRV